MIVPTVEIMPSYHRHNITHALFDFDGTLSLIRDGWTEIMLKLFIEETKCKGDTFTLMWSETFMRDITELTGRQTIIQMQRLAERVAYHNLTPKDPEEYKAEFLRRLEERMSEVLHYLESGEVEPWECMVRDSDCLLHHLSAHTPIFCSLFSGTDQEFVERDARLLEIEDYFGDRIYGATPDLESSSKKSAIQKVLSENGITGDNLIVFGDGMVEIQEAKAVGALAVGVASREGHNGERDEAKRNRLVEAGADLIISDYRNFELWLPLVMAD